MIADSLAGLFAGSPAGPAPASSLLQGSLVTFDPSTGNNTVQLGMTTLTNVPMLLTGAETGLAAGNNVILLQLGNTYCILGKIASSGSTSFASASQAIAEQSQAATNFALPTSYTALCTITLTIPVWANTASVIGSFSFNAKNNFGSDTDLACKMNMDGEDSGSGGGGVFFYGHSGSYNGCAVGQSIKHTVTPGGSLVVKGLGKSSGAYAADSLNLAYLNCMALFTKS